MDAHARMPEELELKQRLMSLHLGTCFDTPLTNMETKTPTAAEVPVTQAMLYGVRDELKSDIGSVRSEIGALRTSLKSKIGTVNSSLKSEIGAVNSSLKSEIGSVKSSLSTEIGQLRSEIATVNSSLKSEIDTVKSSLKSEIGSLRTEIGSEIGSLRSEMDVRFLQVDSRFQQMTAELHRLGVLIEEQNARNTVALDALVGFAHRQDFFEKDLKDLRNIVTRSD